MDKIIKLYTELNNKQKKVLIISSMATLLIVSMLFSWNISKNNIDFLEEIAVINKSDAQKVIKELEKSGIPFEINEQGETYVISTKKEVSSQAKLKLATIQVNTKSSRGWAVFDKSSLGKSSFENKINLIRANEGEIEKALEGLKSIRKAKVSLAMPKDTLFIDTPKIVKASVVLTLIENERLNSKQINGIKRFISNSIPDLSLENVELIDQAGFSLEDVEDEVTLSRGNEQIKYRKKLEEDLEKKLVSVINPVVGGVHNIKVSINLELDFKKENLYEETFDPNSVIRSEKINELNEVVTNETKDIKGVPGALSNIQKQPNVPSKLKENILKREKNGNITNYEISKKILQIDSRSYSLIKKIGATITFNTKPFKPLQIDKIKTKIENIVKSSINFNSDRGDNISVEGFEFFVYAVAPTDDQNLKQKLTLIDTIISKYGFIFKILLVFIILIIFYKKVVSKMNDIKIVDKNSLDNEEDYSNNLEALKKQKEQERNKREMEENLLASEEQERLEQLELERRIKEEIDNIKGLTKEEEARFNILLNTLQTTLADKEDVVAKLLEKLIEVEDNSKNNFL
jgi:flagellar M-ring protein FliF